MMEIALLFWQIVSAGLALFLLPGTLELLVITSAAIFRPRRQAPTSSEERFSLTVLIPAHNEEITIARCIASILGADTTSVDLNIVVIADNCTDATASIARAAGVEVWERFDSSLRGKGYALNFAFTRLVKTAIGGFAVVDADTEVAGNFLVATAAAFRAGADATQCRYLVRNPNESIRTQLMSLTVGAYNVLRARGRSRLGLSAGLYGNGFALAARTIQSTPYTSYSVVEDVEYHLSLLAAGRLVTFLDHTTVYADMPSAGSGVAGQRARWEGGRLRMVCAKLPGLVNQLLHGNFRMLEPSMDLLLPPLTFQVLLLLCILPAPSRTIRDFALAALAVTLFHLTATAFVVGKGLQDLKVLAIAPVYLVWKLMMIPSVIRASKKEAKWVRTERVVGVAKQ
jgi:cellulose synthase/poly-beta-1,6-N-acetylglucosamine synthase-like glycosyltransferase